MQIKKNQIVIARNVAIWSNFLLSIAIFFHKIFFSKTLQELSLVVLQRQEKIAFLKKRISITIRARHSFNEKLCIFEQSSRCLIMMRGRETIAEQPALLSVL